jgi:hypothetical protein
MEGLITIGAMREQISQVQQTLRDHGEVLDEIHDLLQRQRLEPPSKGPRSLDWSKWAPRLWPLVVFLGLLAAQIPAPQAIKIVSQLFAGG